MKLDRSINPTGKGKYALINLRKIPGDPRTPKELAEAILRNPECVEFGCVGGSDEFFLIKLKDRCAEFALRAYSEAAITFIGDEEYAAQVRELADRAGLNSPYCKAPD